MAQGPASAVLAPFLGLHGNAHGERVCCRHGCRFNVSVPNSPPVKPERANCTVFGVHAGGMIYRRLLPVNLLATVGCPMGRDSSAAECGHAARTGMRIDAAAKLLHPRRRHTIETGASPGRVFSRFTAGGWQGGYERQNTPVRILELILVLQSIEPVSFGDEG